MDESLLAVIITCVALLGYIVALVLLSQWIAVRIDMSPTAVVLFGIFLPPAWLVLLVLAAFGNQTVRGKN